MTLRTTLIILILCGGILFNVWKTYGQTSNNKPYEQKEVSSKGPIDLSIDLSKKTEENKNDNNISQHIWEKKDENIKINKQKTSNYQEKEEKKENKDETMLDLSGKFEQYNKSLEKAELTPFSSYLEENKIGDTLQKSIQLESKDSQDRKKQMKK